jgi:hypothetical protein
VKFPVTVRHRKAEAKIYGKKPAYPFYRLAWRANGKRMLQSFATYGEAREAADRKVRELAQGNQAAALSPVEAADALTALQRLKSLRREHGRTATLSRAVSDYSEAIARLPEGRTLAEAVEGWLSGVATVKPHDLAGAVQESGRPGDQDCLQGGTAPGAVPGNTSAISGPPWRSSKPATPAIKWLI